MKTKDFYTPGMELEAKMELTTSEPNSCLGRPEDRIVSTIQAGDRFRVYSVTGATIQLMPTTKPGPMVKVVHGQAKFFWNPKTVFMKLMFAHLLDAGMEAEVLVQMGLKDLKRIYDSCPK